MISIDEASQFLRKCAFFAEASDETVIALAGLAEQIPLSAGETLFEKGELGTSMYFVLDGCVRVHNKDVVITHLDKGQVFGEVAALSKEMRTATVSAEMDTLLLKLEQEAIYSTFTAHPDAAVTIIGALCKRESQIINEKFERMLRARVLENELDIGQRIQQNFLPEIIPEIPGWKFSGLLQPARKVAGDFYDFFIIPGQHSLGIVIGDVCDKGLGAALFMTLFRSLIRSSALYCGAQGEMPGTGDLASTLKHAVRLTNQYIATTHGSSSMFASLFFGLLVPETGQLCYINAGHEALLIRGQDGGIRLQLPPTGPVLGLFEEASHEVGTAELLPGEVLFGYTDGATDAKNEAGEQFSEERLLDVLGQGTRSGAGVLHELYSMVVDFIGRAEQYDDVTMISVYREAP